MTLTSKQRAALRSQANQMPTILQIGKGGASETVKKQVEDALTAREMIKLRVLGNQIDSPHQIAETLAQATQAQVIQVMGTRIVLFRRNTKQPIYLLDTI